MSRIDVKDGARLPLAVKTQQNIGEAEDGAALLAAASTSSGFTALQADFPPVAGASPRMIHAGA